LFLSRGRAAGLLGRRQQRYLVSGKAGVAQAAGNRRRHVGCSMIRAAVEFHELAQRLAGEGAIAQRRVSGGGRGSHRETQTQGHERYIQQKSACV